MPEAKGNDTGGKEAPQNSFQIAPPAITMPKGGGAIRGMGEKFAANPVTGTGSISVPIVTSPGRSGFGPQLSLSYDSGAGNGPFGFGWSLSIPSITRKTDKGLPKYQDASESDLFILSGAEDLVPLLVETDGEWVRESMPHRTVDGHAYRIQRYRPRTEGLFARIERWTNQADPGDSFWCSISKDNITTWYGKTAESRIQDPADPSRIFSWLICQTHDDKGNVLVYGYKPEDSKNVDASHAHERNRSDQTRSAQRYLKRIRYGNHAPYFPELKPGASWPEPSGANAPDGSEHWLFEAVVDYEDHDPNTPLPEEPTKKWATRPDPFSTYRAGFEVRTYRLCQRVLMFHHFPGEANVGKDCLVRSTDFTYKFEKDLTNARVPIYSFLQSVTQSGYVRQGDQYLKKSLPPVEFTYSKPEVQDLVEEVDSESVENLPVGLDGTAYQWTDLHGEGIPGILTEQAGAWFYKRNWSPISEKLPDGSEVVKAKFSALETVALKPSVALSSGAQFMDLAGDGQPDLVTLDGSMPGLYEHDEEEGWEPFRPFTSRLNRDMQDPNLKFVDLDGDGHADVLITEDDAFVWHPSLAEEGFGPAKRVVQALDEEKGPRIVFADGTQSIYLADLSGDGLTDMVRIRNGEVCYWPNLGYGRFGAKVTMDHAPWFDNPDQFDHKRIRLADIDGSGTTDIIYLHRDGPRLYFNQSGNSWSQPQLLNVFPRIDDVVSIVPTDLLGNGTACLVWSSPLPGDTRRPMRYVNMMGSRKPHLLIKTVNNLGAETVVHYAPSTKFYLADKLAGKPWITRLPFPVHVVERVETYDHISRNRFVTRYTYHHGYFDGEEREFRGFCMVEQRDTEEIGTAPAIPITKPDTNWDAASFVPPVVTKTWFHTGAYFEQDQLEAYFKRIEYFQGDSQAVFLPDTVLPSQLSEQEEREACRALKGAMLRQEIYAEDAPPGSSAAMMKRSKTPYTVSEQNYTIELVQPVATNRYAVFFTHPRETLSYHYERNPVDPRIGHEVILQVDSFGAVERSMAIGYARRNVTGRLPEQAEKHMTFTVNRVANNATQPDWYRVGLPVETQTFEVVKPPQVAGAAGGVMSFTAIKDLADTLFPIGQLAPPSAQTIPYENWNWRETWNQAVQPGGPSVSKLRLIEHLRILYRPDDLGQSRNNNPDALLPLGIFESLALPGESYKLAFTPGLLADVYGRGATNFIPAPGSLLGVIGPDEGGYIDLDGDGHWWMPSGRTFYHPTTGALPQTELAEAASHFFIPRRVRDPFRNEAVVTYHGGYHLLVNDTKDAVGNTVIAVNDYRVLQPSLITDPNGNRSKVVFDALGLVVATAVMGKANENLGDPLLNIDRDEANPTLKQVQDFVQDPRGEAGARLSDATTRIIYDLDRFKRCGQPSFASTIAREIHVSDLQGRQTKFQISLSYSDGFGRQVQTKVQAEQGLAPRRSNPTTLASGDLAPGALQLQNNKPQLGPTQSRWVGTGRTVFNNKGKPVKQFEPFFSSTPLYETEPEVTMTGVTPVLFYDPAERVIATLHPNHTYEKVVFDPWRQITYDVNDTVAPTQQNAQIGDPRTDPDIQGYVAEYFKTQPVGWQTWYQQRQGVVGTQWEQDAARKAAAHADTPTTAHLDALGRTILTVAHNGADANGNDILYRTSVLLDIEGNQREVRDAKLDQVTGLGRIVMQYDYDLLSTVIHQKSMEALEQWMLNDVLGKPIRAWKSPPRQEPGPEQLFEMHYDLLRRPVKSFVQGLDPTNFGRKILFEQIVYGDDPTNGLTPLQRSSANLLGKPYRQFDGAGIVTNVQYDFKGNLKESNRQLTDQYKLEINWEASPNLLETFTSQTNYDAMNRPIAMTSPHTTVMVPGTPPMVPSVTTPTYNEAGLLDRIDVTVREAAASSY